MISIELVTAQFILRKAQELLNSSYPEEAYRLIRQSRSEYIKEMNVVITDTLSKMIQAGLTAIDATMGESIKKKDLKRFKVKIPPKILVHLVKILQDISYEADNHCRSDTIAFAYGLWVEHQGHIHEVLTTLLMGVGTTSDYKKTIKNILHDNCVELFKALNGS
jgi:hypothetical protein